MPRAKTDDSNYEIVEPGLRKARCIRMIDRGSHLSEQYGNWSRQFMAMFELPECKIKEGELAGEPFSICLFFNLTIGEKSKLRPLLVGWLGRELTPLEEEAGYEVFDLVDKPAYLNIIHNTDGGKTFANIQSIIPLSKDDCPDRIGELVKFDLDNFDQTVFDGFSEKMKAKIESSREWDYRLNDKPAGEITKASHEAEKQSKDELPSFDEPEPEIDIGEIGAEGKRGLIDFEAEYKALKPRTWTTVMDLAKRKMGDADFKSFFMDNNLPGSESSHYEPDQQNKIIRQIYTVCINRE